MMLCVSHCDGAAACRTAAQCKNVPSNLDAGVTISSCGSAACRRFTQCQADSQVAFSDETNEVCRVNQDIAACPDLECKNKLVGWQGATCLEWEKSTNGFCDLTGSN